MPEWFPTAAVSILVALIAATGALLTWQLSKQAAIRKERNELNRRVIRLINYAHGLQVKLDDNDLPYDPWPDNLYDEE